MGTTLNDTPSANRTHIAFFGRMNSGKSSLLNALAGQDISIVSDVGGTTTDLVKKPMEIHGIGPCVLVDTAGFDDSGTLGDSRVARAKQAAQLADLAVLVFAADVQAAASDTTKPQNAFAEEKRWYELLRKSDTPVIFVLNKTDQNGQAARQAERIAAELGQMPLLVSALTRAGVADLKAALVSAAAQKMERTARLITGNLAGKGDTVLLVMPQDIQAPRGRLILPQVQTLRELLDKKCLTVCKIGRAHV